MTPARTIAAPIATPIADAIAHTARRLLDFAGAVQHPAQIEACAALVRRHAERVQPLRVEPCVRLRAVAEALAQRAAARPFRALDGLELRRLAERLGFDADVVRALERAAAATAAAGGGTVIRLDTARALRRPAVPQPAPVGPAGGGDAA